MVLSHLQVRDEAKHVLQLHQGTGCIEQRGRITIKHTLPADEQQWRPKAVQH